MLGYKFDSKKYGVEYVECESIKTLIHHAIHDIIYDIDNTSNWSDNLAGFPLISIDIYDDVWIPKKFIACVYGLKLKDHINIYISTTTNTCLIRTIEC